MWNATSERNGFRFRVVAVRFGRMLRQRAQRLGLAKHPQRRHHNLSHRFRAPFPILEFARLQPTFDEHDGAFRYKFCCNLRLLIPSNAAHPFDTLVAASFVGIVD